VFPSITGLSAAPWALLLCVSGLLLLLGAMSGLVNARLWLSEPLVCIIAGVALGPHGFGLLRLNPSADAGHLVGLREVARVTLAVTVTAAALRLPKGWLRGHWRGLAVVLGPGMLMMWVVGSLAASTVLGVPPLLALLVGAVITPTDPVLSVPVVSGALAREAVPTNMRHALTAESAGNDGLALPIVMIPVLLLTTSVDHAVSQWALDAVLWQLATAVVIGGATGWLVARCHGWARAQSHADDSSLLTVSIALSVTTLAGLQVVGGNAIVGAFVAGAVFNESLAGSDETRNERFTEALSRFFDLPIMILFGAVVPWESWRELGWRGCVFALIVLAFRRVPAWLLLRRWIPWSRTLPQVLFAGWFGPVGVAALFYACDAQLRTGSPVLWPAVSLVCAMSVIAHGVTGTHFSALLGRLHSPETE
jgi:NhaP-type Na+/H+ or K+/H+ antiporter